MWRLLQFENSCQKFFDRYLLRGEVFETPLWQTLPSLPFPSLPSPPLSSLPFPPLPSPLFPSFPFPSHFLQASSCPACSSLSDWQEEREVGQFHQNQKKEKEKSRSSTHPTTPRTEWLTLSLCLCVYLSLSLSLSLCTSLLASGALSG